MPAPTSPVTFTEQDSTLLSLIALAPQSPTAGELAGKLQSPEAREIAEILCGSSPGAGDNRELVESLKAWACAWGGG